MTDFWSFWFLQIPLPVTLALVIVLLYLLARYSATRAALKAATAAATTDARANRSPADLINAQFALMTRYGDGFSLALVAVDGPDASPARDQHAHPSRAIEQLERLLGGLLRETDVLARDATGLLLVMPKTDLEGACVLGERLRATIEQRTPWTASAGLAAALDGDCPDSLLARARAALDSARAAGGNVVFRHNGEDVESILEVAVGARG